MENKWVQITKGTVPRVQMENKWVQITKGTVPRVQIRKFFLKKVYLWYKWKKVSQFLPKNGQKMAKYLQKKFCTPGTPNILGKKKLYPGYTKKIGAKKTVPRVHQKKFGAKNLYHGYKFQNNLGKKNFSAPPAPKNFCTPGTLPFQGGYRENGNSDPSGGELWPENARAGERSLCTPPRAHV